MKLVFPCIEYKDKAIEYINEFYEFKSEINGTGSLDHYLKESTYETWLENVKNSVDITNIPNTEVPKITYFYVREEDNHIIGMVNIRLALNDYLRREGGHIGYSIRPTERRKNYGTQLLSEALKVCDKNGIKTVLVSCASQNIASSGVIKNCGGVLKNESYCDSVNGMLQMYEIKR